MPELPEMRALSERLNDSLVGRILDSYHLLSFSSLKTVSPSLDSLVGIKVREVTSRAKYVLVRFRNGSTLALHLGNAGRVDLESPPKQTKPRGVIARFTFGELGVLIREFGKERRAGVWVLAEGDLGPLERLGPEPGDIAFAEFILTSTTTGQLHTLLRDQRVVSGIGRGYIDDALHRAQLSPFASLARLDLPTRQRLLESILAIMDEALARERTRTGGLSESSLGDRFDVHRRAGEPCPRCGRTLERVSYESHEVVYCPECQTGGRVLADRRLSRLLR